MDVPMLNEEGQLYGEQLSMTVRKKELPFFLQPQRVQEEEKGRRREGLSNAV